MEKLLDELQEINNEFYDDIPVGEMNTWDLLMRIKKYHDKLNKFIDEHRSKELGKEDE